MIEPIPRPLKKKKTQDCALWAQRGECKKNPKWMLKACATSCRRKEPVGIQKDSLKKDLEEAAEKIRERFEESQKEFEEIQVSNIEMKKEMHGEKMIKEALTFLEFFGNWCGILS